jgi:hypothetical protein
VKGLRKIKVHKRVIGRGKSALTTIEEIFMEIDKLYNRFKFISPHREIEKGIRHFKSIEEKNTCRD